MKIGIIGYGNQSKRIISYLQSKQYISSILVYKKKKFNLQILPKIKFTNDLKLLNTLKVIIICSPSKTHSYYLKYFLKKTEYIFCEKPGFTSLKDHKFLSKISNKYKSKIYFNFNYLKSIFFKNLLKEMKNKKNGNIINFSFSASHGLAFRSKKKLNKPLKPFEMITGNLGVHYCNLLINVFKKIELIRIQNENISKNFKDTSVLTFKSGSVNGTVFLSYASVSFKYAIIHFSNCILVFENNIIKKFYPRDFFSKEGLFKTPKPKILVKGYKNHIQDSLKLSIDNFFSKVLKKNYFSLNDYEMVLKSTKMILDAKKNK